MIAARLARNLALGIENLLLHKLRSLLTMLGIVFGVGSVIAMLSVGEGASEDALSRIRKLGSRHILLHSVKPIDAGTDTQRQRTLRYGLTFDDAERIESGFDTVVRLAPARQLRRTARTGRNGGEVRLMGVTSAWFQLVRRPVVAGRVLNAADGLEHNPVAVLTESVARRLLPLHATLGERISVEGDVYTVVGIVRSEDADAGGIRTPDTHDDVYVPLEVVRARYGDLDVRARPGEFSREEVDLSLCIVEVARDADVEPTAEGITHMLEHLHALKDFRVSVPLALLRQARETKRTFNIVLGAIACISLLVGGIGIMNIMLASVTERTREIGIRRAIGATRRQIVTQFLVETVVLSGMGGVIGIALGLLIPWIITQATALPTIVTAWSVVLSLGISIAVGLVFGIYPASRAARLDPILALRHE
jgi:putative ABC transport system permease protein